jgi:hypothetical protein
MNHKRKTDVLVLGGESAGKTLLIKHLVSDSKEKVQFWTNPTVKALS